jgi:DNA-binding winged helix-turn-helix (wHTH) protein
VKPGLPTVGDMQVELVRWPTEEDRLTAVRTAGRARLVMVAEGSDPPITPDPLEDWVRLPASDEDVRTRVRVLEDRQRSAAGDEVPDLDGDGLLRISGRWVSLPPVEHRLMTALLDRYRTVVSRDALARAGWPDGIPGRNVLDVHIVRLRRRIAPLGLVIRTVRSRGYLLESAPSEPTQP